MHLKGQPLHTMHTNSQHARTLCESGLRHRQPRLLQTNIGSQRRGSIVRRGPIAANPFPRTFLKPPNRSRHCCSLMLKTSLPYASFNSSFIPAVTSLIPMTPVALCFPVVAVNPTDETPLRLRVDSNKNAIMIAGSIVSFRFKPSNREVPDAMFIPHCGTVVYLTAAGGPCTGSLGHCSRQDGKCSCRT